MSDTPAPRTPEQWGDELIDEPDDTTALVLESQLIEQTDNSLHPEDPDQPWPEDPEKEVSDGESV